MTLSNWISDATPVRARLAGQSLAFPSNKGFAVWNQFLALEVTGKMPVLLQTPVGQASRRFDCEAPKPEHSGRRFSAKLAGTTQPGLFLDAWVPASGVHGKSIPLDAYGHHNVLLAI